jgi:hypothetical protein
MATIPRIAAAAALVALAAAALASSSTQAQRLSPYVSDQHFEAGATDGIVLTDPARGGYASRCWCATRSARQAGCRW